MESIKEENVKLSREVVTTVPNTWLVEATNPATGQTKMIDIANYAAVVAGVLNKSKGVISDCNSATTSGIYTTTKETLNQPKGGTFGFVNVIPLGSYIIQEYISISSDKIQAFRVLTTTNMSDWQRADTFGCNTLAELSEGVAEESRINGLEVLYKKNTPKDFNECNITGVYSCGGTAAENGPTASPFGTMIVFNSSLSSGYTIQMFFSKGSTFSIYVRFLGGEWKQIF